MNTKQKIINALEATIQKYPKVIKKRPKPKIYCCTDSKSLHVEWEIYDEFSRSVNFFGYEAFVGSFIVMLEKQLKKRHVDLKIDFSAGACDFSGDW
jgi:hypothetical protein